MKIFISTSGAKKLLDDVVAFAEKKKFNDITVDKHIVTFERPKDGSVFTVYVKQETLNVFVEGTSKDLPVVEDIGLDELETALKQVTKSWYKAHDPEWD